MTSHRLTNSRLKALKTTGQKYQVPDGEVPGLAVIVSAKGVKSFTLQYRVKQPGRTGRLRTITLGRFPDLLPETARRLAREARAAAAAGDDPGAKPAAPVTLATFAAAYLDDYARLVSHGTRRKGGLETARRMIERNILPAKIGRKALGELPVNAIERRDVIAMQRAIEDRLRAQGRDGRRVAGHALTYLKVLMNRAELDEPPYGALRAQGSNPCQKVPAYISPPRRRVPSGEELARLAAAIRDAWSRPVIAKPALLLFTLLILTGARKSEIMTARREQIIPRGDGGGLLRLEVSKTGPKDIVIPAAAMALIRQVEAASGNPYLISAGRGGGHMVSPGKAWAKLCRAAKIEGLHIHDLRRHYISQGLQLGYSHDSLAKLVGHSQIATTARYAFLDVEAKARMAETIAKRLLPV